MASARRGPSPDRPRRIASPIGTIAAVQVAAAVPNFRALEWHGMSVPFWEDLAAGWDGKVTESGRIRVPEGPGLGDELNLDVAREDEPRQWVRSRIRLAALSSPHEAHAGWEGHDDRALAAEHDAVHGSQEPDPSANALCQRAYREAGR